MSFTMKASKGGTESREKAPAGNHPAVLVAVIDLGHQHHEYKGESKWNHDLYLVWELPTKKQAGGKSFLVAESVTMSLNEKAKLRSWVEGMLGKPIPDGADFDISQLLGKPCLLQVQHTEKGYPYVKAPSCYPEGMQAPAASYDPVAVTLAEFQDGATVPEWVPWMWCRALGRMCSIPEVIGASQEVAGDGAPRGTQFPNSPTARGGATHDAGTGTQAPPPDDAPPPDGGPDPAALWDYHDGKAWVVNQTTAQVQAHIALNRLDSAAVWVRPAGTKASKRAFEFQFQGAEPLPY